MEPHGENRNNNVVAIIPARYASTRLPGKLLREICGEPLILHTLRRVKEARNVSRVIVATDDERIMNVVRDAGGEAVITRPDHVSGSDRVAEAAKTLPEGTVIVNVQGDEPMISPRTIEAAVEGYLDGSADIVTTSERVESAGDVLDPHVVKVVTDADRRALYFSRSPIPFDRDGARTFGGLEAALQAVPDTLSRYRKHTGLYVYSREYLMRFSAMPPSPLELTESLEQLRALETGAKILVVEATEPSIGVDTDEDLARVTRLMEAHG